MAVFGGVALNADMAATREDAIRARGRRGTAGPKSIPLEWVQTLSDDVCVGVNALFRAVVEQGGAIGFIDPPSLAETRAWLRGVVADVEAGNAGLAVVGSHREVRGIGCWRREHSAVFATVAGLHKVASHPTARGQGLGRAIVCGLLEDASSSGIELVSLGTRGNNEVAMRLYRSLGFMEWGRLPNAIAVGAERYDDVRMYRPLAPTPRAM